MAGVAWTTTSNPFELTNLLLGVEYACLILGFLTAHEFGHYFAAKYHKVPCTLPYYIPFPITPLFPISFGTMGAVIRVRGAIPNTKALFDIGASGPLAGFVVCYIILAVGLATLPDISYIQQFHPEYVAGAEPPEGGLVFGNNLFWISSVALFADTNGYLPPLHEIYHYPWLNVGWFGLFVTALNMLPLGQLDGGHILFSMIGKRQWSVSKVFWWLLIIIGFSSILDTILQFLSSYNAEEQLTGLLRSIYKALDQMKTEYPILFMGWGGWLFWAVLARFVTGIKHPPVPVVKLGVLRIILGILTFLIFIMAFSPRGIYFSM
ncbi:MAG: site-2 protease family protein [Candidatus Kapaibacteriales bacterium]